MPAVIAFRAGDVEKMRRKLDAKYLVEPEFDDIFATAGKRAQRQGKGIASRRNTITLERTNRLSMRVVSTRGDTNQRKRRKGAERRKGSPRPGWMLKDPHYNPRIKGDSWEAYNLKVLLTVLSRSISKAAKNIEARWSA
jgi:hypothetical protein